MKKMYKIVYKQKKTKLYDRDEWETIVWSKQTYIAV